MIDLIYNCDITMGFPCLLSVLEDLGRGDIPAYRGASRDAFCAVAAGTDWPE
jgi:hypothetical protein